MIARPIVRSFSRCFLTGDGASPFHLFSAGVADRYVTVAGHVGTVDHAIRGGVTDITLADYGRVLLVDRHDEAVVKDITDPFKGTTIGLLGISEDAASYLIYFLKAFGEQVGGGLAVFDACCTADDYSLVFMFFKGGEVIGKLSEVLDGQDNGVFKPP